MPTLPENPSLDHLRKQAKEFLREYRAQSQDALRRLDHTYPRWEGKELRLKDALQVIAAEYRYPSWVLLKQFIERKQQNIRSPYEQCCDACLEGDVESLRRLLEEGESSFTTPMNWGDMPLIRFAIIGDDVECVALLLDLGSPTSVWEFDVLEKLQDASEDVRALIASRREEEERLVDLIEARAFEEALSFFRKRPQLANAFHDAPYKCGPLMLASKAGHLPLVQALLDAGARVDSHVNNSDVMALTFARVHEHAAVVALLERHGAKSNEVAEYHYAASQGKTEMVKRYLEAGMDVNAKDNCQHHVLPSLILSYPKHAELLEYVLSCGADINRSFGWEDYIWFEPNIKRGEIDLIRRILEMGIDVNQNYDRGKYTPVWYAQQYGQKEIEQLLYDYGAKRMDGAS